MIKGGNTSLPTNDLDHLKEARYKRRTVHVRTLRIPSLVDEGLVKKVTDQCNAICANQASLLTGWVKKFCHEVVLWRRLDHRNLAQVLGVTMDPYQILFDRVSDKDIVQYTSTEEGVDRVILVSLFTILSSVAG